MIIKRISALLVAAVLTVSLVGITACGRIDYSDIHRAQSSSESSDVSSERIDTESTGSDDSSDIPDMASSEDMVSSNVSSAVALPEITTQPKSLSVTKGGSVKISVKAKGKGLKYQWYFKKSGQSEYSAWKGYTKSSATVTHDGKWEELLYYCMITDSTGNSAVSDTAIITLQRQMRVLAVGDSICRGGRNSHKGFVGDLGLTYLNLGQNGATLSTKETKVTNIPKQLSDEKDFQPDIVIADGGVNDYIYNVPLGTVPTRPVSDPNKLSDKTLATAMGGLQRLFALMSSKYPNAQRYFVITHKTTQRIPTKVNGKYVYTDQDKYVDWTVTKNKAGYTQQELHDAIVACCKVYDVEVIDVYTKSALNTADPKYRSQTSYSDDPSATDSEYVDIDGVHPLDRGYREFYIPLIRKQVKASQNAAVQLEIVRQPVNQSITLGDSVTLSVKASGSNLKYQWFYKKAGQTAFSEWKGRTHDSETVTPNDSWDGIQLYCVVVDGNGKSLQSDTVTVKVK